MRKFRSNLSVKSITIIVLVAACFPLAAFGWADLYMSFFERLEPYVYHSQLPRGIGLSPVSFKIDVGDDGSGLSYFSITKRSRPADGTSNVPNPEIVLERNLKGQKKDSFTLDFFDAKDKFATGAIVFEIVVKDSSLWKNRKTYSIELPVDFTDPKITILSAPSELKVGDPSLIIYKAADSDIADTGVTIGKNTFVGYSARLFDADLSQEDLFVSLITIPPNTSNEEVRLFAEDRVGNSSSIKLPITITELQQDEYSQEVSDETLFIKTRKLFSDNTKRLTNNHLLPEELLYLTELTRSLKPEEAFDQFKAVSINLYEMNNLEISSVLLNSRSDRYWRGPFIKQISQIQEPYGSIVRFTHQDKAICSRSNLNHRTVINDQAGNIIAVSAGIVVFAEDVGVFGKTVVLDHGLGLATVYSGLESMDIKRGQKIEQGVTVGRALPMQSPSTDSNDGGTKRYEFNFEVRLNGVQSNPAPWFDRSWYSSNVASAVEMTKRKLGVPIRRSL